MAVKTRTTKAQFSASFVQLIFGLLLLKSQLLDSTGDNDVIPPVRLGCMQTLGGGNRFLCLYFSSSPLLRVSPFFGVQGCDSDFVDPSETRAVFPRKVRLDS